ncbi:Protein of unknown function (DUF3027) [Labedella gwakjiensis]|uniref:DUF3027 domain-containing protein n=1 Tax=Labedella gwakjiensis TaxID=390269 RepID=A0A2P8GRF9_9MICO|nr:DUF3027 domain-containing protein [Labedella gwakjiensis]PSL36569.1 Protein of unknown function (DUF3027) [Labedella gwakjiensis]RUQ85520.1 DUF3027 domain-containing protein [Labedella gwakjiensis]
MPEQVEPVEATAEAVVSGDAAVEAVDGAADSVTDVETPLVADETLVAARGLARTALLEVTPERTVGPDAGHTVEAEHVLSLRFSSRVEGYVGWFWTVTIARVGDEAPTVLEISMMPGEGALTAPDWVPWSDRLADYRASQEAAEAAALDAEGLEDDDDIDESDLDEDDDDLDIDEAAVADDDEDSDDDESDDDDFDDDSDDDDDDDHDDDSDEEERVR